MQIEFTKCCFSRGGRYLTDLDIAFEADCSRSKIDRKNLCHQWSRQDGASILCNFNAIHQPSKTPSELAISRTFVDVRRW